MFVVEPAVVSRGGRSSHQIYRCLQVEKSPIHPYPRQPEFEAEGSSREKYPTIIISKALELSPKHPLPVEARLT